jgi:catechol 2,3-dioxygenase-like lactoylglutathione lyase family enzyme
MNHFISGIQQIGIGVSDARAAMLLYKKVFGMDVLIFDDISEAYLMTKYTGNKVRNRRAILSMNLAGGGGVEIWQPSQRATKPPAQPAEYGDIGIFAAKIKCFDVQMAHSFFTKTADVQLSPLYDDPSGRPHFWVTDEYGNCFNIVKGSEFFKRANRATAGITGAVIGVVSMEKALHFYRFFLGINEIIYDVINTFSDTHNGAPTYCRRVLLKKKQTEKGAFSHLLGAIEIELVQSLDRQAVVIFKDRLWGDNGFIHLCFDVINMEALKKHAATLGISFTVDSHEAFAMENAAGRFCYSEDPDGTLIELVETHKIPIVKKIGWFLNLRKRDVEKPLPRWMINMLSLSKVT